jgi:hypothetical protein
MKERDREKRERDRWRERLNERDRESRLTVDEQPSCGSDVKYYQLSCGALWCSLDSIVKRMKNRIELW